MARCSEVGWLSVLNAIVFCSSGRRVLDIFSVQCVPPCVHVPPLVLLHPHISVSLQFRRLLQIWLFDSLYFLYALISAMFLFLVVCVTSAAYLCFTSRLLLGFGLS